MKIPNVIFTFFLSYNLICTTLYGQNNVEIHNLKNEVLQEIALNKKINKKKLKIVLYGNVLTYTEIYNISVAIAKDYSKIATKALVICSSNGIGLSEKTEIEFIQKKILKPYELKKINKSFLDSVTQNDLKLYENLTERLAIENHYRFKWIKERDSTAYFNFSKLDSINFEFINDLLFKKNYSPRQKLYFDNKFFPLFLHVTSEKFGKNKKAFEEYRLKILDLVLKGKFDPVAYGVWVDRFHVFNLGESEQIFGTFRSVETKTNEIPPVIDPENLNIRRKKIGLKTKEQEILIRTIKG